MHYVYYLSVKDVSTLEKLNLLMLDVNDNDLESPGSCFWSATNNIMVGVSWF